MNLNPDEAKFNEVLRQRVVRCKWCGSAFTLPKDGADEELLGCLSAGMRNLDLERFEDAYRLFDRAAHLSADEPEAYWGMALSEYRVRFLKDYVRNGLQPVCYEFTEKKFTENKNYLRALELATAQQRVIYQERASEIDRIRAEFLRLREQNVHFDCFFCLKVTNDATGRPTEDCRYADELYRSLKKRGVTPFYSEVDCKDRAGADYEALILYALYTSACMLVICGDESYLRTPWMQNEYARFLRLTESGRKQADSLAVVYNGTPVEKLPGEMRRIQGIDRCGPEATDCVLNFIGRHVALSAFKKKKSPRVSFKKQEPVNLSGVQQGDRITFGRYPQFSRRLFFWKKEPVEWDVLYVYADGNAFLVSSKILDSRRFRKAGHNYAKSEIRAWLNGKFYKKAFNKEERARILRKTVDNVDCVNTEDYIFLLSADDVRYRIEERSARSKSATFYSEKKGAQDGWWLRTPAEAFPYVMFVDNHGDVEESGVHSGWRSVGIVPAMIVRLDGDGNKTE